LKLEIWTTPDVFDRLGDEWNDLLNHSQPQLIFLTREWQQTWWEAYHPGDLYVIVGRTADRELAGIAPWFIEHRPEERVMRAIGCVEVTDYLSVIAAEIYQQEFFCALADHLAAAEDTFDRLSLCNIPEDSVTLKYLPDLLEKRGFAVEIVQQEVCPIVNLPQDWEEYLARLDKKQRHELRRKLRRATNQVDWYITDPEHDLTSEIARFLRLMAASSEEKALFLQDERNTAFFRAIIPRLAEKGWLQLSFLTVEGEPAAAYLNFDYNKHVLVYNSGQDNRRFGAYSPGIVLLAHTIRHAIEQGRRVFDFLRGSEPYKYQMGGQDTRIFELKATRA
jgi:CelD/BcsL family acetyltransferase involved in cellulose biosynthesis